MVIQGNTVFMLLADINYIYFLFTAARVEKKADKVFLWFPNWYAYYSFITIINTLNYAPEIIDFTFSSDY